MQIHHSVSFNDPIIKVRIRLIFTPKDITPITPHGATALGTWNYDYNPKKTEFFDFIYLREEDMPILNYTQEEYEFNGYVEDIARKEYEKLIGELIGNYKKG